MILCEVVNKFINGPWNENYPDWTITYKVCNLKERPNIPMKVNIFFKQLIRQCWNQVIFLNKNINFK